MIGWSPDRLLGLLQQAVYDPESRLIAADVLADVGREGEEALLRGAAPIYLTRDGQVVILRRLTLRGADLREANLQGADLREANLREAIR